MTATPDGLIPPFDPPLNRDDIRHLFDLAVDTPLVCSGSFDTDDVNVLRRVAALIGVDPNDDRVTPTEFASQYPHPFKARRVDPTPRMVSRWHDQHMNKFYDSHLSGRVYSPRPETPEETAARVAEERADLTCHVGPGNRPCGKPADDPIHTEAAP